MYRKYIDNNNCKKSLEKYEQEFINYLEEAKSRGYATNFFDNDTLNMNMLKDIIQGHDMDETFEFLDNYFEFYPEEKDYFIKELESKRHYYKKGIEFFVVRSILQKEFIVAFYGKRSKIVGSEAEAFAYFQIQEE